jgi:hypothetical protein
LAFDVGFLVGLLAFAMFEVCLFWVWLSCRDVVGLGSSKYWHLLRRLFGAHLEVLYAVELSM